MNWEILRQEVFKRDDYKCRICGKEKGLQCHHITRVPRKNRVDDCITLCGWCHWLWHNKPEKNREFKEKIIPIPKFEHKHLGVDIAKAMIYRINFGDEWVDPKDILEVLEKFGNYKFID